ncbi:vWA domain-containing protein [Microbacterium sp. X-17]|uniref:vWA domain-containing protein n=1 Tax=Microbacterium sp. X-17 TaxID=3144404 RepID=UPI0031F599A2
MLVPIGRKFQGSRWGAAKCGSTDEEAKLVLADPSAVVDPEVRARARRIAALLSVPRPRLRREPRRGVGRPVSLRYREGATELDLDKTTEVLAEEPFALDGDLVVRERDQPRRSVVLLVDLSGSMKGEKVRTAAATVGAVTAEFERDRVAVIAFWSDAAMISPLDEPTSTDRVLDTLLRIPAQGLTNVAFPLQLAARELRGVPTRDARVILLSDCVHNAGPQPQPIAASLPRLDVLLDASGEHDAELARDLARHGRGRVRVVRRFGDVAPALSTFFQA